MKKYDAPSAGQSDLELRETAHCDLVFPVPSGMKSWRGLVDPGAALAFSQTQLARFWSDPEYVRRREASRVLVPFEL